MARGGLLLGASLVFHAALAFGVESVRTPKRHEVVAITMAATPKKAPAPPEPAVVQDTPAVAPSPQNATPRPNARNPGNPRPATLPPQPSPPTNAAVSDGPALDVGLSMQGGIGAGSGGGGGPGGGGGSPAPAPTTSARAAALPKVEATCDEAATKPKPRGIPTPAYNDAARSAGIEGRVRVEVSVGADGKVTSVRVLQGLGHGLDEAALAAAKSATFEPATRCGQPVAATFVIGMRFAL